MKLRNILWVAALLMIPANVWAYGDSGASGTGTGICKKVNFSEFKPGNNTEAAPHSEFSFYASGFTVPNSIKVTIKGHAVPITVTAKQEGYKVSGKLPDGVKGVYAKINIDARGVNQCEVTDGWLVKVTE